MNQTMRNLLVAGALFIVGLMLVTSYISGQNAKIEKGNDYIRVLVAKKDIPSGTKAASLTDGGYVTQEKILRRDAAPQVIHDIKDVEKLSLRQNVYAGEQLTAFKFETKSALNPGDQIRGTERLIAVHIEPTGGIAGLVRPGDHVDIMGSSTNNVAPPATMMKDCTDKGLGNDMTWVAARNALVLQTPDSLQSTGDKPAESDPSARAKYKADAQLFVLQISDQDVQNVLWTQNHSDDDKLQLLLRPTTGAQETKLPVLCHIPDQN